MEMLANVMLFTAIGLVAIYAIVETIKDAIIEIVKEMKK